MFQDTYEKEVEAKIQVSDEYKPEGSVFFDMDYVEIISFAIDNELKAASYFNKLSDIVKDQKAKELLKNLAREEKKHADILEQLLDYDPESFDISHINYNTSIKEAKYIDTINEDSSVTEVIMYALGEEDSTYLLYKDLAKASNNAEAKDTFIKLGRLELVHKSTLEKWYKELCTH